MSLYHRSVLEVVLGYVLVFVLGVLWDAPWSFQKGLLYVAVPVMIERQIWFERQRVNAFSPSKVVPAESPRPNQRL